MYAAFFIIGFMTSFGWWTAGKVQKIIDGAPAPAIVEKQPVDL
jgi:hypothetical protein